MRQGLAAVAKRQAEDYLRGFTAAARAVSEERLDRKLWEINHIRAVGSWEEGWLDGIASAFGR